VIRYDEYGVLDALEMVLIPEARAAIYRGIEEYGLTWREHYRSDWTTLENVKHTWETHARTRLQMALEALDYGDLDGFEQNLGSMVGYIANMVLKAHYSEGKDG